MRLSGKRVRCLESKLPDLNHRPSPWLTEDDPRRPLEPLVRPGQTVAVVSQLLPCTLYNSQQTCLDAIGSQQCP
jgi:hypothetical protein